MGGTRHWRGSSEYTETGGEEAYRTKIERKTGKMLVEQVTRMNLGGGKRKVPNHHDGKHRNLI